MMKEMAAIASLSTPGTAQNKVVHALVGVFGTLFAAKTGEKLKLTKLASILRGEEPPTEGIARGAMMVTQLLSNELVTQSGLLQDGFNALLKRADVTEEAALSTLNSLGVLLHTEPVTDFPSAMRAVNTVAKRVVDTRLAEPQTVALVKCPNCGTAHLVATRDSYERNAYGNEDRQNRDR